MAIQVFPSSGDIVAASFANALNNIFGGVARASTDQAFSLKLLSQAGGNNTWQLQAGTYIFNGYVFVADGTETIAVPQGTATSIYLYYTLSAGYITAAGLSTSASAGTARTPLQQVNGPLAGSTSPGTVTDYRRINIYGRSAYANTDADAVTLTATRTTLISSGDHKQFRVAYPGNYNIAFEYLVTDIAPNCRIDRIRGGVRTTITSFNRTSEWTAYSGTVSGCLSGDIIALYGTSTASFRNAYLRYKLQDPGAPAVLLD